MHSNFTIKPFHAVRDARPSRTQLRRQIAVLRRQQLVLAQLGRHRESAVYAFRARKLQELIDGAV